MKIKCWHCGYIDDYEQNKQEKFIDGLKGCANVSKEYYKCPICKKEISEAKAKYSCETEEKNLLSKLDFKALYILETLRKDKYNDLQIAEIINIIADNISA